MKNPNIPSCPICQNNYSLPYVNKIVSFCERCGTSKSQDDQLYWKYTIKDNSELLFCNINLNHYYIAYIHDNILKVSIFEIKNKNTISFIYDQQLNEINLNSMKKLFIKIPKLTKII